MSGYIYKVTCLNTNKLYIGQASEYKIKNNKPYNYGITGRWNDHVSSSKTHTTPLNVAIHTYGRNAFVLEELEKADKHHLDALEAKWISHYNTVVPNGYNIAKHSRNRHHESTDFYNFYKGKVEKALIRPIKKGDELKLVYVVLYLANGENERIAFGQKSNITFEDALNEATEFLKNIGCSYKIDTHNSEEMYEKYKNKLDLFTNKTIYKIKVTSASKLIGVYVHHNDGVTRICFGGKTIVKDDAYNIAKEFIKLLNVPDILIEDVYQSPQQATAL